MSMIEIDDITKALNKNQNLSGNARNIISCVARDYIKFFKDLNIEIDMSSVLKLFENLQIINSSDINNAAIYNPSENCILISTDPNTANDVYEWNMEKSILSVITNVYNNDGTLSDGLTFEIDDVNYGHIISEKLKDRIVESVYGNPESEIVTIPTIMDGISRDFQNLIGSEKLITYLVNGRGDLLFSDVHELCDSKEECIEFFSNLNQYETVDKNYIHELNNIDAKYEKQINKLLERKMVNKLDM